MANIATKVYDWFVLEDVDISKFSTVTNGGIKKIENKVISLDDIHIPLASDALTGNAIRKHINQGHIFKLSLSFKDSGFIKGQPAPIVRLATPQEKAKYGKNYILIIGSHRTQSWILNGYSEGPFSIVSFNSKVRQQLTISRMQTQENTTHLPQLGITIKEIAASIAADILDGLVDGVDKTNLNSTLIDREIKIRENNPSDTKVGKIRGLVKESLGHQDGYWTWNGDTITRNFSTVYGRKYVFNNVCFNNFNVVHTSGVTNKDKVHTPDSNKPNLNMIGTHFSPDYLKRKIVEAITSFKDLGVKSYFVIHIDKPKGSKSIWNQRHKALLQLEEIKKGLSHIGVHTFPFDIIGFLPQITGEDQTTLVSPTEVYDNI